MSSAVFDLITSLIHSWSNVKLLVSIRQLFASTEYLAYLWQGCPPKLARNAHLDEALVGNLGWEFRTSFTIVSLFQWKECGRKSHPIGQIRWVLSTQTTRLRMAATKDPNQPKRF